MTAPRTSLFTNPVPQHLAPGTGRILATLADGSMDVLLISQVFPPQNGGSGRWLWELYRRLDGVRVHVAAAAMPGDAEFDRTAPLPIERLPLRFSGWGLANPRSAGQYVRALRGLRRMMLRSRPQAIHCGKCLPEGLLGLGLSTAFGVPYVCYAHGEELMLARRSHELRLLTALVLRRAQLVVANSRFTRRLLLEEWGVPEARVTVMHPGVDASRFAPAPHDAAGRARLGWTGRRVVLTVGALQQRKGQDMVIRALPSIRRQCPDVLYAVAGEGWERERLERLAREHGVADIVQFLGTPDDAELITCYQQCDLFVLANRQVGWDVEGFGMALVEAQA